MARFCWRGCGRDADEPDHWRHCDPEQGEAEAADADFDGETYEPARDKARLHAQLTRVLTVLRDQEWHTLGDLAERTRLAGHSRDPEASISARIRDLRKEKFGGYNVPRRYVGRGLWEYRLELPVLEPVEKGSE